MIVPSRISEIYDNIIKELELFKNDIDPVIRILSSKFDGLFSSRIKSKESFAQKVETGRFDEPTEIVDLYAATIVVPTYRQFNLIESEIDKSFEVIRKIKNREKKPSDFIYDDVHLHIRFQPGVKIPGKEYLLRPFELQLKTFLQHGWAMATHDITYKGNQLSWRHFRIGHQIKAMLEQADQILAHIDKTATICPSNKYKMFIEKNEILKLITKIWKNSELPQNVIGLVNQIYDLLDICKKSIRFLKKAIDSGKYKDLISARSLTPYQVILGIFIKADPKSLYRYCKSQKRKIYMSKELRDMLGNVPDDIDSLSIKI